MAAALVAGGTGYGAGRFAAPTKVETREVVREVQVVDEKVVEARIASARSEWERNVQDHTRVVTRYVEGKPVEKIVYVDRETQATGGTVRVETKYVDREVVKYVDREVVSEKVVERDCPRVTLLGSLGSSLSGGSLGPLSYGLEGHGRFAGPFVAGLGGEGNAQYLAGRVLFGIQF